MDPKDFIGEILTEFYNEIGINYNVEKGKSSNLTRYFNFRLKLIETRLRNVYISKESVPNIFFSKNRANIFKLLEQIRNGIDVNPHQSRQFLNPDYHDMLFNDWAIHHLHLSHTKKNENEYFHERTGELLFLKIYENDAYVLNIKHHKDKNVWSNTDIIRLIRNNWNFLLKPFEVGSGNWFPNLNDEEIGILRNKGYTFSINVDDKAYLMLGHGYAVSGDNGTATSLANEVIRWIGENLETFNSNKIIFKKLLKEKMGL